MGLQGKVVTVLIGSGVLLVTGAALGTRASAQDFPGSFGAETAPGFSNSFTTKDVLSPKCAEAIAATPGSDPASKVLNGALNDAASFQPGGTVHYTYLDDPHTNPGTQNFTIQDCVVVYPPDFFSPGDLNSATGVLINPGFNKQLLVKGGTEIDGASLSGITNSVGDIYFTWTAPRDIASGTWVCNFARDIRNNHGGGGNRKAPPACYQVPAPPPPTTTTTARGTTTTLANTTTTTEPVTTTTSRLVSAATVTSSGPNTSTTFGARVLGVEFTAPESAAAVQPDVAPVGAALPRTGISPRAPLVAAAVALCLGVWLVLLSFRRAGRGAHR